MPGKGKGKQKKKQQSAGQANKEAKIVKQPEANEFDSDIDRDDDIVDVGADNDTLEDGEEVTVRSKVQEDKQSGVRDVTDMLDKTTVEDDVVEENGAASNPPIEKKLTRRELKKLKKKVCKNDHKVNNHYTDRRNNSD